MNVITSIDSKNTRFQPKNNYVLREFISCKSLNVQGGYNLEK